MESFYLENPALLQEAKEKGLNGQLLKEFEAKLGLFLGIKGRHITPRVTSSTTSHEGPFGIIPPPAKRQLAKEILAGQPLSPLRILEETVAGTPERNVDQLSFHFVAEVNPLSATRSAEAREVIDILKILGYCIGQIQKRGGYARWSYKDDQEPAIVIKTAKGILHLLKRGILGNYSLEALALNSPAEVTDTINAYQTSLVEVYQPSPADKPKDDLVAHMVLFPQIGRKIFEDSDDTKEEKLVLPIVMSPKIYRGWSIPYGLKSVAKHEDPFLLRDNHLWQLLRVRWDERMRSFDIVDTDGKVKEFSAAEGGEL